MTESILIAGIGNIFLGDDAFGVEVVRELARRPLPPEARLMDFGIRGLDLAYTLIDPWQAVILIDAVPRGGEPGTLYVLQCETERDETAPVSVQPHQVDPEQVLRLAQALGAPAQRVILVGCEPASVSEDMQDGLSSPVQNAVSRAADLVLQWVEKMRTPVEPAISTH